MAPDGAEIIRAITRAIESSRRRREEIGYVNYHGTSTVLNDAVESRCVRQVFGHHAERLPGSSVKSMIGHPQAPAGGAGAAPPPRACPRGFPPPPSTKPTPAPAADPIFFPTPA